jgi:hypothetical protein
MKHERFKEWLHLSIFDELSRDEEHLLEEHLESCDECAREREELVQMLETISASGAGEPSEELLQSAQESLRAALWQESLEQASQRVPGRRVTLLTRLENLFRGGLSSGYRTAIAATAMILLGFVLGFYSSDRQEPGGEGVQMLPATEELYTGISDIRFLDADARDGEIDIVYNQVRPMRLRTGMDDPRVRTVLAYALLKEDNPGVRLKAINVFGTDTSSPPPGDMKEAFLEALTTDPNPGVRLQALYILRRMPFDEEIKRTVRFVLLHDENPGVRIAAMNYLSEIAIDGIIPEQEMYDIMQAVMMSSRNNYVHNGQGI